MPRHGLGFLAGLAAAAVLLAAPAPGGAQAPTAFRSALLGEPPHIDPQRMADFGSFTVTSQIYSTLTILDDKLQIVPYAAEKWTVSPDGLTWTFKLRDNLVFHNGRKADANDVKYSLIAARLAGLALAELLPAHVGRRRLRGGEQAGREGALRRPRGRPPDRRDPPPVAAEGRPGDAPLAHLDGHHRPRGGGGRRGELGRGAADRDGPLEAQGVGPPLEGRVRRVPPVLRGEAEGRPAGDADRPGAGDAAGDVPERRAGRGPGPAGGLPAAQGRSPAGARR